MALSAAFAMSMNSQTTIKLKNPRSGELKNTSTAKGGGSLSPMQITGGITCNTQYVAGTTMDLNFTVLLTNTDSEYGDLITITFPAGITPNTSASNTPTVGTGATYIEALNPIAGQSISWGDDDNSYGGIVPGTSYNLTVNVTIAAGLTGNQNATYDVSGDTYGAAPGDLLGGTAIIYPAGATINDLFTSFVVVLNSPTTAAPANNCSLGTLPVLTQVFNLGNVAASNFPINYMVNGVSSTVETYTGTILPGDSAYVFYSLPYNFAPQGMYNVKAWTALTGDIALGNDTASTSLSNSLPVALSTTSYSNGIESAYDFGSLNLDWVGPGLPFGPSTATKHTGAQALFYTVNMTTIGAPAGTYESFINLPCVDVVNGESYRISYWRKANTSGTLTVNGQSAIFTGTAQTGADMTTVLKPYSAITPNAAAGTWTKDSVDYVATATETRYFAIGGKGTLTTTANQINVRIDDISITKVTGSVGIKGNTASQSISIFPNPTAGILNINAIEANGTIEVYNVIGDKVYSNSVVKGNNSIDLSGLANGAYFLKVNSNNQIISKKVVLSK